MSTEKELQQWLRGAGPTLDSDLAMPRGMGDRLRFAATVLACPHARSRAPVLAWRSAKEPVACRPIEGALVVGREPPEGLALADRRLSARQFSITVAGEVAVIEDLDSRNGTWVNGTRICRRELVDGDIIEAGSHLFLFLRSDATVPASP